MLLFCKEKGVEVSLTFTCSLDDESENDDADEEWLDNSESEGDYQYNEDELQEWEK